MVGKVTKIVLQMPPPQKKTACQCETVTTKSYQKYIHNSIQSFQLEQILNSIKQQQIISINHNDFIRP